MFRFARPARRCELGEGNERRPAMSRHSAMSRNLLCALGQVSNADIGRRNVDITIYMIWMRHPEDLQQAFETAWNNHDIEFRGALFHKDVTVMNRFGHYRCGVEMMTKLHAPIHTAICSDSALKNELIDVVAFCNDVASRLSLTVARRLYNATLWRGADAELSHRR